MVGPLIFHQNRIGTPSSDTHIIVTVTGTELFF